MAAIAAYRFREVTQHVTPLPLAGVMPVLLITVRGGKDKPYGVKEKGFYIRIGATNRLATRYELDEMYSAKQNLFGGGREGWR